MLAAAGDDPILPQIVWQNVHPLLQTDSQRFLALVKERGVKLSPEFTRKVAERVLATSKR